MCLNESIRETVWLHDRTYPHPETCTQHSLKCVLAVVFRSSADCICTYWLGLNWIRQSWHNLTPSSEVIIMIHHFTAQQVIRHPKLSQRPRNRHNKLWSWLDKAHKAVFSQISVFILYISDNFNRVLCKTSGLENGWMESDVWSQTLESW